MTRLKKELIKKPTTSSERIRRIKDQKKVVNSKSNVKISEFHVKRLLEAVDHQQPPGVDGDEEEENNNEKLSTNHVRISPIFFYTIPVICYTCVVPEALFT